MLFGVFGFVVKNNSQMNHKIEFQTFKKRILHQTQNRQLAPTASVVEAGNETETRGASEIR